MGGWIVHRSDRPKPYLARFQPKGGRTVSRSFGTKREAQTWLKVQTVDNVRGEWLDPRRGDITLCRWTEQWLAGRRVRESTQARDESVLRSLVLPHLGDRPLNRLSPVEIREWIAALDSAGKAPNTVRKAYQLLGSVIGQAVDDGRLVKSPLPRQPGLPEVVRRDMKLLTLPEVHRLAGNINPRYSAMVLAAGYTGMRWGELAGLRVANIDLLRGSVTVASTLTEVQGEVRLGPPKTKHSSRTIAIARSLAAELGSHIGKYPDPDNWIFSAPNGGPLRRTNFRRRVWRPAVEEAGLGSLRFHDLRHSHASTLIAQGEHPKVISERLGHSSIRMTLDVYGHLMPGMDQEVADRLDEAWLQAIAAESRTIRAPGSVHPLPNRTETPA